MTAPHRALVSAPYRRDMGRADSHAVLVDAVGQLLAPLGAPAIRACDITLRHTPLGQPQVGLQDGLCEWLDDRGLTQADVHVSFSHDGDQLACLAAVAPGLRGAGVDLVHLPRLRRRTDAYLRGLARRFMGDAEWRAFEAASAVACHEALCARVATHFALMEATSKALGTGLKLGFGHGTPESLAPHEITVAALAPEVAFRFGAAARERLAATGADGAAGHAVRDGEYVRAEVFLWRSRHCGLEIGETTLHCEP